MQQVSWILVNGWVQLSRCRFRATGISLQKTFGCLFILSYFITAQLFSLNCSGRTEHNPHLLKYSCQIECRFLTLVKTLLYISQFIKLLTSNISVATIKTNNLGKSMPLCWNSDCCFPHIFIEFRIKPTSPAKVLRPSSEKSERAEDPDCKHSDDKRNLSIDVMLSKPILALRFNCLKMDVESPLIVSQGLPNPTEK